MILLAGSSSMIEIDKKEEHETERHIQHTVAIINHQSTHVQRTGFWRCRNRPKMPCP